MITSSRTNNVTKNDIRNVVLVAGIYSASLAWGLILRPADRQEYWEKWDEEFGGMTKATSIVLIVSGLLLLLMELA